MRRRAATVIGLALVAAALSACSGPGKTTETQPASITAERRDVPPSSFSLTIRPPAIGGER